jgi:hypothetical protein
VKVTVVYFANKMISFTPQMYQFISLCSMHF